jgi:lipopolysaccharide export system protein LptC
MQAPVLHVPRRLHGEAPAAALDDAADWIATVWPEGGPDLRHSRRVAMLKRVLPVTGLALLLLVAVWPRLAPLWERMRLAFPAIDLREARELRMINPRYAGADRLGRPFVVTAAIGRQVPDRQDLMSLEMPRADVKTQRGADIVVTAATGIYQSQAQLLDLFGDVTLVHQNGTSFVTDSARVDVAGNAAEGSDPVVGHGPSGDVKAQGFRVVDRGDTIIFTGRSDLLLRSARPSSEKTVPPELPAPAATAQVEAAARSGLARAQPAARRVSPPPTKAQTGKAPARLKTAAATPH